MLRHESGAHEGRNYDDQPAVHMEMLGQRSRRGTQGSRWAYGWKTRAPHDFVAGGQCKASVRFESLDGWCLGRLI